MKIALACIFIVVQSLFGQLEAEQDEEHREAQCRKKSSIACRAIKNLNTGLPSVIGAPGTLLRTDGDFSVGGLTNNRVVLTDGDQTLVSGAVTDTEIAYLSGVSSPLQSQLDNKASLAGASMTGPLQLQAGSAATPSIQFTGSTNTGISAATADTLSFDTNGTERLSIGSTGTIAVPAFSTAGVVHNAVTTGALSSSLIVNADVSSSAAITDTKLATISTAGKVSNSATTATSANTVSAIIARDGSGNFSAGTITASLTGAASLNVLKAGDTMTGTLTHPAGSAAAPSIQFTGSTNTGISAATADTLSFDTNGTERLSIGSTGTIAVPAFSTAGVVHNAATTGALSSSLIVNADVSSSAAITDTKLATISTVGKVSNSATTATSANTVSAIIARDGSGNFSAGTITASLTGAASLNVLKTGDTMTGTLTHPAGSAATPSIQFTGSTNTGISAATANTLSFATNGTERLSIGDTAVTVPTALIFSNICMNQATQAFTVSGNNQTVTCNPSTALLILNPSAARTGLTVNFPPNPTNGQMFTMMLGTANSLTLMVLVGGTGGASIINGVLSLNAVTSILTTTLGSSASYIYLSSAGGTSNAWYYLGR